MKTSKWLTVAALALSLAAQSACEKKEDGYRSSGSKYRSGEPRGMSGTSWLQQAAEANLAEIDAGRLAGTRSTNADVKQFGLHMVEDHSKANIDLTELAVKKGLTLPTRPDEKHAKATADLADLSGAEFDRKYVDLMVTDHEQAVALFEANGNSSDADVKAFADKMLPTLKHHLQMARDLKGKLGTPKAD